MRGHPRGLVMVTTGLAALVTLLLAGCAPPDGIDGDLTDNWAAVPEPVSWLPAAGDCQVADYQRTSPLATYEPVACATPHMTETAHVGEFAGEAADRVTPPPDGSPEWREAYTACDEAAADYLGLDFRDALLWLGVTVPSVSAWEGGARWFRCELVEFDVHQGTFDNRSGSLGGLLEGGTPLRLGCHQAAADDDGESLEQMDPVGCDEPHNAEYVGVWLAEGLPYPDPEDEPARARVLRGCREQVAEYVDLPVDGNLVFRTGAIATWMPEQDWDNGDRGFRCYLFQEDAEFTESLEGAGTAGLPVQ